MKEFWLLKAKEYCDIGWNTNIIGTHPELFKVYKKYSQGSNILDYGCGDGSLIEQFTGKEKFSFFDVSKSMLDIAENKYSKTKDIKIIRNKDDIEENNYDAIFLSMVLICIDSKDEIRAIIKKMQKAKKKDGYLFIANGHPCFRNYTFSDYFTDFVTGNKLNYFEEGQAHKVTIRSTGVSFTDHNWSISFIVNEFVKHGFKLQEIVEYSDNNINNFYNPTVPPSIIYVFK